MAQFLLHFYYCEVGKERKMSESRELQLEGIHERF